jgi:hypothetical protein
MDGGHFGHAHQFSLSELGLALRLFSNQTARLKTARTACVK